MLSAAKEKKFFWKLVFIVNGDILQEDCKIHVLFSPPLYIIKKRYVSVCVCVCVCMCTQAYGATMQDPICPPPLNPCCVVI